MYTVTSVVFLRSFNFALVTTYLDRISCIHMPKLKQIDFKNRCLLKADSKYFPQEVGKMAAVYMLGLKCRNPSLCLRAEKFCPVIRNRTFISTFETIRNTRQQRSLEVAADLFNIFGDGEKADRRQKPLCMRSPNLLYMATCLLPTPRYLNPHPTPKPQICNIQPYCTHQNW